MLVYKFFQFAVEWILTIRNKAEIIFSLKNHMHTGITDKELITVFCVSGVFCSPPQSAIQIK